MNCRLRTVAAIMPLLLAACASTPEASPEQDREAKRFVTHPDSSTLYIYRTDGTHRSDDSLLWINGRLIGATLPLTFFKVDLNPGRQRLSGLGIDNGVLEFETRPGEAYFVRLQVISGHSRFEPVTPGQAKPELADCCGLLENWRPGQRPLLR